MGGRGRNGSTVTWGWLGLICFCRALEARLFGVAFWRVTSVPTGVVPNGTAQPALERCSPLARPPNRPLPALLNSPGVDTPAHWAGRQRWSTAGGSWAGLRHSCPCRRRGVHRDPTSILRLQQLSRARGGRVCRHLPAQLPVPLPRRAKNTTHTNARFHFLCHTPFSPIPFLSFHHRFLLSTLIFLSSRHLDRTDPGIQETPPRRLL